MELSSSTKVKGIVGNCLLGLCIIFSMSAYGIVANNSSTLVPVGEMPPNDFRITHMGPDTDTLYKAYSPSVAYNSQRDQFLVVWFGTHNSGALHEDEFEIWGRLVDGTTGVLLGPMLRISFMGTDGDSTFNAYYPDVVYNTDRDEFLVVWQGDDTADLHIDEEYEIWGQRVGYKVTGELERKGLPLRISSNTPIGNADYDACSPAVAYNANDDEYLVVWHSDDNTPPHLEGEFEIYGQLLGYDGSGLIENGSNFIISSMGPSSGDTDYDAYHPDVAYNSGTRSEYLVVWYSDHNQNSQFNDEYEVWGRRILADGTVKPLQQQFSDMGVTGDEDYDAWDPTIAFNPDREEFLVVWPGNYNTAPHRMGAEKMQDADNERTSTLGVISPSIDIVENEIYGQILAYAGADLLGEAGTNDFRISDMGPDGDNSYDASLPAVAYDNANQIYLVVWYGDDNTFPLVAGEYEIFAQGIDAESGAEVGGNDLRLSDMGGDGLTSFAAYEPALDSAGSKALFLVTWDGDDNFGTLVDGEFEIFGQLYTAASPTFLPAVYQYY